MALTLQLPTAASGHLLSPGQGKKVMKAPELTTGGGGGGPLRHLPE